MHLHPAQIIKRNLAGEDLWFLDLSKKNAYFVPGGWYMQHTLGELMHEFDANEIYGYAPTGEAPNSGVETMWIDLTFLYRLECVDEQTARKAHPKMAEHLDELDSES